MKNIARISAFILASTLAVLSVAQGKYTITSGRTGFIKLTGKETFTKLIKDGKYYSVDEELTEINPKFPAHRKGNQSVSLVSFQETMPIEDLVAELKARGLRPTTLVELLAFGVQDPYAQDYDARPILSPDATLEFVDTYDEERMIQKNYIYLRRIGDKRILSVNVVGSFWNKNWRCLAVKLALEECKTGTSSGSKSSNQERR